MYRRPFEQPETFGEMSEGSDELRLKHGYSSITLSGVSAVYGAVREILRSPEYFTQVNNVQLIEGMNAGFFLFQLTTVPTFINSLSVGC